MSEVVKINNYDIKDLKAVRTYDNVAAMKNDTKLRVGQHVKTKGYYSSGDGGESEYIIKSTSNDYYETLTNELVAELVHNNKYNVKQFGVKADVEESQNSKLNSLISIMNNGDTLYFPAGSYYFTEQIVLQNRISLIGDDLSTGEKDYSFNGTRLNFILSEAPTSSYALIDCSQNNKTLIKNIYVYCNSYTLSCNRTLQSTNSTPVDCFTETTNISNIIGIKLYNYGSEIDNVIIRGCSIFGLHCGFYNLINNVRVYECRTGFYCNNDNTLTNCNCFTCRLGISIEGSINLISNFRADEIQTNGIWIQSSGNNITNITIDYAQYRAFEIDGDNNYITGTVGRVGTYYAEKGDNAPENSCYGLIVGGNSNRIDINVNKRNTKDGTPEIYNPCYSIVTRSTCSNNRYNLIGVPKFLTIDVNGKLNTTALLKELIYIKDGKISDTLEYNGFIYQFKETTNTYAKTTIYSSKLYNHGDGEPYYKYISTDSGTTATFNIDSSGNTQTFLVMIGKNQTALRGLYLVGYSAGTGGIYTHEIVALEGVTFSFDSTNRAITVSGLVAWSNVTVISPNNITI